MTWPKPGTTKEEIMDLLDEQVEAMQAMIRAAGGKVYIPEDAPGEIKRAFLEMIRECPDCRAELAKKGLVKSYHK